MRSLLTISLLFFALQSSAQFDAPGTDPTWLKLQPNPYARLKQGNGPYPAGAPRRTEYYNPVNGGDDFSIAFTWDNNWSSCTITGGKLITPTQAMMGVPRMWRKGYSGKGVGVMVVDLGCCGIGGVTHQSLSLQGTYSPTRSDSLLPSTTNSLHTMQVISQLAARDSSTTGVRGGAFNADVYVSDGSYFARSVNKATRMSGVRIIESSLLLTYTDEVEAEIKNFLAVKGGVVILAAGNDTGLSPIQQVCSIKGVVCVGSTIGGGNLAFVDSLYAKSALPIGNKTLDYVLPNASIGPGFDLRNGSDPLGGTGHDNFYQIVGGTSFTAPQVAGVYALMMQRYPRLTGEEITAILKYKARKVTISGVTTYVLDLNTVY